MVETAAEPMAQAETMEPNFEKSNMINKIYSTPATPFYQERKEVKVPYRTLGVNELGGLQLGAVGIGQDLWAQSKPLPNGTSRVYDPLLGTTSCVLRGSPPDDKTQHKPSLKNVSDDLERKVAAKITDFQTVGKYLEHKQKMVYPRAYALKEQPTLTKLTEIRPIIPKQDLDVYKMIDHLEALGYIRRQAIDRCIKIERLAAQKKTLADELYEAGHRYPVYTFMDNNRNICVATDCFELPTHDPNDSPFMAWLTKYGMAELMETYSEPLVDYSSSEQGVVVVPELGWELKRPTIYVARIPPKGNTTGTTLIWTKNNDAQRLFGDLKKPKFQQFDSVAKIGK